MEQDRVEPTPQERDRLAGLTPREQLTDEHADTSRPPAKVHMLVTPDYVCGTAENISAHRTLDGAVAKLRRLAREEGMTVQEPDSGDPKGRPYADGGRGRYAALSVEDIDLED